MGDAELQSLSGRLDVRCDDGKWLEDGQFDLVNVGASAIHDEVLVESGEGELAGTGSEEGEGTGDFAEDAAIEAVLLAFLADDGHNAADQAIISIRSEERCYILERAEDDVGEG